MVHILERLSFTRIICFCGKNEHDMLKSTWAYENLRQREVMSGDVFTGPREIDRLLRSQDRLRTSTREEKRWKQYALE
jgi:hypothetical protein